MFPKQTQEQEGWKRGYLSPGVQECCMDLFRIFLIDPIRTFCLDCLGNFPRNSWTTLRDKYWRNPCLKCLRNPNKNTLEKILVGISADTLREILTGILGGILRKTQEKFLHESLEKSQEEFLEKLKEWYVLESWEKPLKQSQQEFLEASGKWGGILRGYLLRFLLECLMGQSRNSSWDYRKKQFHGSPLGS